MLEDKPSVCTPLFHGSRAAFERLHEDFFGTGEGTGELGFSFTGSLSGACHHAATLSRQSGEPLVYVCRFRPEGLWLRRGKPISAHPVEELRAWNEMPAVYSCLEDSANWYESFFRGDFSKPLCDPIDQNSAKIRHLKSFGFSAIGDYEGSYAERYHEGATALVIDPAAIEVVEVLKVSEIGEGISPGVRYRLEGRTQQLFGNCSSRLRRAT